MKLNRLSNYTASALALGALAGFASGCTGHVPAPKPETISESDAEKLAKAGKVGEAAEVLARIGEILILPEGVEHASAEFDKALALDPKNAKANLYSSMLKPLLAFKG